MASNLQNLDSLGGFSVDNTTIVNETFDIKNVNTLQVKNSFFADSYTEHYIMRGLNTSILEINDTGGQIFLPDNTINFIESTIVGVNDSGGGNLVQKLESAISVNSAGTLAEMSTMTTIIKDTVPQGQTWTINPFVGGSSNSFSYTTSRAGTTISIKWIAYTRVVSIQWT
jgi:hypothetical protein